MWMIILDCLEVFGVDLRGFGGFASVERDSAYVSKVMGITRMTPWVYEERLSWSPGKHGLVGHHMCDVLRDGEDDGCHPDDRQPVIVSESVL